MKTFFDQRTLWQSLKAAVLGIAVFGMLAVVSAYTDPTQAPPQGGTLPVNVGPTTQRKEGILLLGPTAAAPAVAGSLSVDRNLYVDTNTGNAQAVFFGERNRARADFPSRTVFGVGWDAATGFVGMFGADWRVMDNNNPAILKNVFANDYWIGTLNKWASQLGSSGPIVTPPTPNLQQVTDAGNATNKKISAGGGFSTAKVLIDTDGTGKIFSNGDIQTVTNFSGKDVWLAQPNFGSPRWASQPSAGLGQWEQRGYNTTYTAATDGFVTATIWAEGDHGCISRIETPVGNGKQLSRPNGDSPQLAMMSPVRKGDTWVVNGGCPDMRIFWIPLGN